MLLPYVLPRLRTRIDGGTVHLATAQMITATECLGKK